MAAHEGDRQKESGAGRGSAAEGAQPGVKAPPPNPLMLGLSPSAYVLRSVSLKILRCSRLTVVNPKP